MVNVSMPHADLDRRSGVSGTAAGVSRGKQAPYANERSSAFGSMVDSLSDDGRESASTHHRAVARNANAKTNANDDAAPSHGSKTSGARVANRQSVLGKSRSSDATDEKAPGQRALSAAADVSASVKTDDQDAAVVVAAALTTQLADLLQRIKDGTGDTVNTARGQISLTSLKSAMLSRATRANSDDTQAPGASLEEQAAAVADTFIKSVAKDVVAAAATGEQDDADAVEQKVATAVQRLLSGQSGIDLSKIAASIDTADITKTVKADVAELVKAVASREAGAGGSATTMAAPHTAASSASSFANAIAVAQGTGEPKAAELPDSTVLDLVRAMRMQATEGGGEARIQLRPEHFGEVTISIRVEEGQVLARVQAESASVREWLQNNQNVLRHQLAEQQLTLDRLEVAEPAESQEPKQHGSGQRPPQDQRRARRPRQDDEFQTFEVVA